MRTMIKDIKDGASGTPWHETVKDDFPIFGAAMNNRPVVYLDSASSAQKPRAVIAAMSGAMEHYYANIHRGLYAFSQQMTAEFEAVRGKLAAFINAASDKEIIFTRNTTEAINLVVNSWGRANLKVGDEIILTAMEHHANIVPWQILQKELGFAIRVIPVLDDGWLDLAALPNLLCERTKMLAFVHVSNVLGTVNPAAQMIRTVKAFNPAIMTLVDASQSAVHGTLDVQALGCDFLCMTGHKLYGPTGAGVLYGRYDVLDKMPPWMGGGDMIVSVDFAGTTFQDPPHRFEAGTPSFIDVIGLGAAIDYMTGIGMDAVKAREDGVFTLLSAALADFDGITVMGTTAGKAPVLSFTADWAHASDLNMILDQCGVCVRTGKHCAEPLMKRFGVEASIRASLGLYNDENDVDRFAEAMRKARKMLA